MAYDLEEQEQLATLKGWWRDHGGNIVLVVAAVAIAFSGWQVWRWYLRPRGQSSRPVENA